jgi:hypothetical protein
MTILLRPLLAYAVLVIAALWLMPGTGPTSLSRRPQGFAATRDLPPNHRVRVSDLRPSGIGTGGMLLPGADESRSKDHLVGMYVGYDKIKAGAQIVASLLRHGPDLTMDDSSAVFFFSLTYHRAVADIVEPTDSVRLCDDSGCTDIVKVVALLCPRGEEGPCAIALEKSSGLSQDTWARFAASEGGKSTLVLHRH